MIDPIEIFEMFMLFVLVIIAYGLLHIVAIMLNLFKPVLTRKEFVQYIKNKFRKKSN